ncbi:endonuclease domain-containing protein [Actinomadura luteofluorescens]|uniref:endonuclease domain-containing protein n=1 Tax=Actinomadura luteofluorescens TaxID=46163 RepID=UPI003D911A21
MARTLPDHEACGHTLYRLSCDQYESLLAESGRGCQICGLPSSEMPDGKLYIDHGGAPGNWPVRGLLCISCNSRLKHGMAFSPKAGRYLEDAWYARQCRQLGISIDGRPEPPAGTAVQDNFGNFWVKELSFWQQIRPNKAGRKNAYAWTGLNALCGPFNLHPVDCLGNVTLPLGDLEAVAHALRERLPAELMHHLGRLLQSQNHLSVN